METRSSYKIVGAVTLALVAAMLVFTVWLAGYRGDDRRFYDIFFRQAVSGLAKGSAVSYSGVSVGVVEEIGLLPNNPGLVRVRVSVQPETPIVQGVTASIAGVGFTGVSEVRLSGGQQGASPIACPPEDPRGRCPFGVPVIPTRPGGLAAAIEGAPELIDRLTALTGRLTEILSPENQRSFGGILGNVDRLSSSLADRGPEIAAALAQAREALKQAGYAANRVGQLANTTEGVVRRDAEVLVGDLRRTITSAEGTIASAEGAVRNLDTVVGEARPGVQAFSKQTIPDIGKLVGDLQQTADNLERVTNRLDRGGVAAVLGSPKLPDYEAGKTKR